MPAELLPSPLHPFCYQFQRTVHGATSDAYKRRIVTLPLSNSTSHTDCDWLCDCTGDEHAADG